MKLNLIKLKSAVSTNNTAIELITKGQIKPSIIIANNQSKGRGRYGKKWISQKGNLFISISHPIHSKKNLKIITKTNCKIIKHSLSQFINKKIKIKPPNDLLIDKKKVCGILQEIIIYKKIKYLVIGIGINLCKSPQIRDYPTTHLSKFMNKKIKKSVIYNDIKKRYENYLTKK